MHAVKLEMSGVFRRKIYAVNVKMFRFIYNIGMFCGILFRGLIKIIFREFRSQNHFSDTVWRSYYSSRDNGRYS